MPTFTPGLTLSDGEIDLVFTGETPADPAAEWLAAFYYRICLSGSGRSIGSIEFRPGYTLSIARYGGHFGYRIEEEWRGHHFAGKACRLLKPAIIAYGMDVIWITCNPGNWASRKTCEWIGATLVEIVDLPPENDQYLEGERQKCRYRWILY